MFRLTYTSSGCKRLIPISRSAPQNYFDLDLGERQTFLVTNSIIHRSRSRSISNTSSVQRGVPRFGLFHCRSLSSLPGICFNCTASSFLCPKLSNVVSYYRCFHTNQTHYEVLGVSRDATADDIRAAFLRRSKECHPDTNSKDQENHKEFVLVNEAYSVLSKPVARRDYDISLSHGTLRQTHSTSRTQDPDVYYHYPEGFYQEMDPNKYKQYEKGQENKPYYGIPGLKKVPNSTIVIFCVVWIIFGIVIHLAAVRVSSAKHIKVLDERDAAIHEIWMKAKEKGRLFKQEHEARLEVSAEKR